MDILMLTILAACYGSTLLLLRWCKKQIDRTE